MFTFLSNSICVLLIYLNIYNFIFFEKTVEFRVSVSHVSGNPKLSLKTINKDSVISNDYLLFANPLYNFRTIDINRDGVMDFCIGLIKTTRWNKTVPKPKIHIYSHKNGKIYPIWRSSRIGKNLVDFESDTTEGIPGIRILENPKRNKYNIALYRWRSFGLKFVRYLYQNLDFKSAKNKLRS